MKLEKTKARFLLVAWLIVILFSFAGCNPSDTIMQIIYDQNPENEVDASQTLLVNDPDASQMSDTLPKLVSQDSNSNAQQTTADMPRYGGDTSQALVAKPEEALTDEEDEVETSIVADIISETTSEGQGVKREGEDKSGESEKGDEGDDEGDDEPAVEFDDDTDGTGDDAGDDGENPDFEGDNQSDTGHGKNANNEVKVYKDYGDTPEIPEGIEHVTAVGQAAVIVSMLGGTSDSTPLVGADANLLGNADAQRVLSAKGISNVASVWNNDGTTAGDLASTQAVIDLDPELCFVMEGDDTLTPAQEEELLAANIIVYVLPSMASPSKISYAVELVGEILAKGGNVQAGSLAERYREFHNDLVNDIAGRNNGVTGGFDYDLGREVDTGASQLYSLYISDWDESARYSDPDGFITTPEGVGVADVGYEAHPVSYYMSVGGVTNTAATSVFRVLSGYRAPVWQFSLTQAPCTWASWQAINRKKVTYELKGNGFSYALLWADEGEGYGVGSPQFPGVIVATQAMKSSMEREATRAAGIYFPYPATSSTHGGVVSATMVGFFNGSNLVASCIGTSGEGLSSFLNDGSGKVGSYGIYVNPHGLFSSWADGSVESVLETAWVYKTFRNEDYDLDAVISRFYSEFYGYELGSELATVLDGRVS